MSIHEPPPVALVVPRENVNDESATLVAWRVDDGARVEAGQSVAQIETSKAVVDIVAPVAGTLRHAAKAGDEVAIGGVLAWLGAETVPREGRVEIPASPLASDPTPTGNGAGRHEAMQLSPAVRRLVAEGNVDPAALKGTGRGGRITKSDVLDHLETPSVPAPRMAPPSSPRATRLSRRARERIRALGLDELEFSGRGLVRAGDVVPTSPAGSVDAGPPQVADTRGPSLAPGPVAATGVPVRSERLSRAKRTEARYLRLGAESTLTSVVTVACPTRGLREAVRRFPALGGNATALIVFEVARLLRSNPALNGYHHEGTAYFYDDINIGFAVDAGRGLKVPVIHHADRKTAATIAEEMRELVVAYLDDALPVASLAGGTFTLTDLSGEGVTGIHPLINQGQSAILGVCAEVFPSGIEGGSGSFNLILAFDHQLSDGRAAAQFLGALRDRLSHYEAAASASQATGASSEPRCSRCQAGYRELAENGHALVQTVGPDGSMRLLCKLCFEGWV
jgi:pyruvate/2-oxoglutarate dehydrogenase complex dihydrolipoamide acyltransferase (E2) component